MVTRSETGVVRALITGAGGQVGRALQRAAPPHVSVQIAAHADLDIADRNAVESAFSRFRPDIVLNAAGFTNVDLAEEFPEKARRANHQGPKILAETCAGCKAWFVHISTSYVFDGAQTEPYATTAQTGPLSIYGKTKLDGEQAVSTALPGRSTIVRTSWLHSAHNRHFLSRMLHLLETQPVVHAVCDQFGTPTSADGLASALWALGLRHATGTFHWSDVGVASWYEFAQAIAEEASAAGALELVSKIVPISSAAYAARARRPAYSLLDNRGTEACLAVTAPHWRRSLADTLAVIASERRSMGG